MKLILEFKGFVRNGQMWNSYQDKDGKNINAYWVMQIVYPVLLQVFLNTETKKSQFFLFSGSI